MPNLTIDVMAVPESGLDLAIAVPSTTFNLESSDVHLRDPVELRARITRAGTNVAIRGEVTAAMEVSCVRCLEQAVVPVREVLDVVLVPSAERPEEEDHELVATEMDFYYYDDTIDFRSIVWDHLVVTIPIQPVCSEDCRGLCPYCGTNLNLEQCSCVADEVDERLAVLKRLKHHRHHE